MTADHSDRILDPSVRNLIRRKAERMTRRAAFRSLEACDLEQELVRQILERLPKYDPTQGSLEPFLRQVVLRLVANLFRQRRAKKRDDRGSCSLQTSVPGESGPQELAQVVEPRHNHRRRGQFPRSPEESTQLALDLAAVLAKATPRERMLAERLGTNTMAEIARELNLPPSTLYHVRTRLLRRFEQAGLRDYL